MSQSNSTMAAIIVGIIVVIAAGFGIYKWRSTAAAGVDAAAPGSSQTYQQMQQDYSGARRGARPPRGSAGAPGGY